jgi:RHH-type transcriptional regulator, proline utilization regulon repressor / proline dehydrogenase / delta 1-pyrroline-5-carboxylate dehydrogenase
MDLAAVERDTVELAREIAALGSGKRSRVYRMSFWSERVMDWAMSRPEFKTQLFRFVDVFPALGSDDDVARHLREYLDGADVPRALDLSASLAGRVPLAAAVEARSARRNIERMAEQFILGATAKEAVAGAERLWRSGRATTIDLLGEKTVTAAEADRYQARVLELLEAKADAAGTWPADERLERDDLGPLPRVNLSIKPTALATHYEPLSRHVGLEGAAERIRPILHRARALGAHVQLDMEHADVKDLTLELFRDLLADPALDDLSAGVVVQAYLKDARTDLADLIAWGTGRKVPITIRLVKGAYWDAETVQAAAAGWPSPVFERKEHSDASFERCARMLLDHHGQVRAAFGSHNLRSLAHAVAYARHRGIPDHAYEIQLLHGMAEPVHDAVGALGLRLRVYAPVGELVPGMAYLVRRLLENTSNESFVRHRFAEGRDLDELLVPPEVDELPGLEPLPPDDERATDPHDPGPYRPEPTREWRRAPQRVAFGAAIDAVRAELGIEVPGLVDGEEVRTRDVITSVDPGDHEQLVATSASCGVVEADAAVAAAARDAERWRRTPAVERAAVLFAAAARLRARRDEIAALECYEAGKPWEQADADVCEAIDFCEYYARQAIRLEAGGEVDSPPGEANRLRYQGKGVTAVIAPWNFPLAIPCGMVTAALAAGNPAILKPAEQAPAVAWRLAEALRDALAEAGAPAGAFQLLPGVGEDVGAHLVQHPEVACISFTGSLAVGLEINRLAALTPPGQRHIKQVVAELGGKNALIVDDDADLDQAVPAAVLSAFGYAGQKCSAASRLIVLDRVHDAVLERTAAAASELLVGHAAHPGTQVGPLIDADAHERVTGWIERAPSMGRVVTRRTDVPAGGWYVGPTIVEVDDPGAPIATEEIFGPVLCVLRARDLDHAIEIANGVPYALTAGILSRSPANLRRAAAELRAGNVYLNRHITGAVVGRQPFGGYGLSGVGAKAGGPDHLLQLMDPRVTTENTLRQGFEGTST